MDPSEFYAAQVRTAEATAILARRQWRTMRTLDDWPSIVSRLTLAVTAGQVGVASRADSYVSGVVDVEPVAAVNPRAFGGVASDGRQLDTLLFSSVVHARSLYGSGAKDAEIMAAGQEWLDMLVRTQVADAGRGATQVAIAARPRCGWYRFVSPPCCQRCAVLAGKWFKWNQGFDRHPRCDCVHRPATQDTPPDETDSPSPDQIKDLTKAQRQAIADGADMNQVINSHRVGSRSADRMTTTEGTTRRGWSSYVTRALDRRAGVSTVETVTRASRGTRNVTRTKARLTPDAIYRLSSSQAEAQALLVKNGYMVGDLAKLTALIP